jgi:hypothetical protein
MTFTTIRKAWFAPVISTFIKERTESLVLAGVGVAQVGLVYAHLPGWPCPFKAVFGIPCPGCGLSTACSLLLHGHWQASLQTHAFAPFFLLGIAVVIGCCLLPESTRSQVVNKLELFERRSGVTAWFLVSLFLYWGLRLFKLL